LARVRALQRVEEAAVAHLEAKLEDTAGALDDSR